MSENKSIIKSASIISLATLFSRLLGFIRDIVIAAFFGTGLVSEAFFVAFRIPNLLRDLVGEGAANSAFVPVFCEYLVKEDKKSFWKLVGNAFWIVFLILAGISLLGVLLSRPIVSIIAPGFLKEPDKFLLTTQLTRILFPYLLLIGLTAFAMGLLHTFKSFTAPAFASSMLNICIIASIFIASGVMPEPVFGVAVGVLIGGVLQVGIQIPSLFRKGFQARYLRLRTCFPSGTGADKPAIFQNGLGSFLHPGIKKIIRLLIPRIFGSAVHQLNVLIDTVLASFAFIVGAGAVAAIYYANRIIQFPLAIFGIALSSAVLPTLSRQAAVKDMQSLRQTLAFSLRTVYLFMFPAAVGLLILTKPIIQVLFQRGNFDFYSVQISSAALFFYSFGLIFFGGMKILITGFYSLQDTRTPVKIACLALLVNFILNVILMFPLKVGGLALASSLTAVLSFSLLYLKLKKKIGAIFTKDFYIYLFKITVAGFGMLAFVYMLFYRLFLYWNPVFKLLLTILMAVIVYVGLCLLFRVQKLKDLARWIKRG